MSRSILSVFALTLCLGCGASIRPGQAGLKYRALRHPGLSHTVLPEGYYALWAWNKMIIYDITAQERDEEIHSLTADNLHVPATVTVTFRPRRSEIYDLHTQIGPEYYEKLLGPAFITLVRAEFSKHLHNNLASESPEIEEAVRKNLQALMETYFLNIDRVSIKHIDYDETVTQAISRKIAVRQQLEQKKFEVEIANRDADIVRTAAQGHSDAARISAEGQASAVISVGKAQAEAQEAIGKTLTSRYLQYKAFDNKNATFYFVPTGRDGLPVFINTAGPK